MSMMAPAFGPTPPHNKSQTEPDNTPRCTRMTSIYAELQCDERVKSGEELIIIIIIRSTVNNNIIVQGTRVFVAPRARYYRHQ